MGISKLYKYSKLSNHVLAVPTLWNVIKRWQFRGTVGVKMISGRSTKCWWVTVVLCRLLELSWNEKTETYILVTKSNFRTFEHEHKPHAVWKRVLWTGEGEIKLCHPNQQRYVWRNKGAAFDASGMRSIPCLEERMDYPKYQKKSWRRRYRVSMKTKLQRGWCLQQDTDLNPPWTTDRAAWPLCFVFVFLI